VTSLPTIKEFCERLVQEFHPDKVILFGSYAYGQPTDGSDVDVLVILPFEGTNFRKSLEILNRLNPRFAVDLLARRPEDIARRFAEGDPLVREALERGTVLYERDRSRVAA
jgi:predicted nucleotidyltransferase